MRYKFNRGKYQLSPIRVKFGKETWNDTFGTILCLFADSPFQS